MKNKVRNYYSCKEIRQKILKEGKLPAITGNGLFPIIGIKIK